MTRNGRAIVGVCGLVLMSAIASSPGRCAECEDCGIQSLFALHSLATGAELDAGQRSDLLNAYPNGEISMLDIRQAAQTIGISLKGIGGDLAELAKLRGAKILHLRNPDHFAVLAAYRPGLIQLVDSGGVMVVPEDDIGKRYTGHALILAQETSSHGPRLKLSEFAFDFGTVAPGSELEIPFTVTNTGDEYLTVTPAEGCCGAPDLLLERERVAPGQSLECLLVAKPTNRGTVLASRGLLTNDPGQPLVYVSVYGYVLPDIAAYPPTVFVAGEKGDAIAASVVIRGPADLEVISVSCKSGFFQATLTPQGSDDRGVRRWHIALSRSPSAEVGEHKDELVVQFGGDRPALVVPITARVRPDLEVIPSRLFLGLVGPNQGMEREVVIRSRHGHEFAITDIRSNLAAVSLGTPREVNGKWVAPVRIEFGGAGVVKGTITVATDVPGEATLTVRVYAHIGDSGKGPLAHQPSARGGAGPWTASAIVTRKVDVL